MMEELQPVLENRSKVLLNRLNNGADIKPDLMSFIQELKVVSTMWQILYSPASFDILH